MGLPGGRGSGRGTGPVLTAVTLGPCLPEPCKPWPGYLHSDSLNSGQLLDSACPVCKSSRNPFRAPCLGGVPILPAAARSQLGPGHPWFFSCVAAGHCRLGTHSLVAASATLGISPLSCPYRPSRQSRTPLQLSLGCRRCWSCSQVRPLEAACAPTLYSSCRDSRPHPASPAPGQVAPVDSRRGQALAAPDPDRRPLQGWKTGQLRFPWGQQGCASAEIKNHF